jgi:hypothetical protein
VAEDSPTAVDQPTLEKDREARSRELPPTTVEVSDVFVSRLREVEVSGSANCDPAQKRTTDHETAAKAEMPSSEVRRLG